MSLLWVYLFGHRPFFFKLPKKICRFGHTAWKGRLANTVKASFNTTVYETNDRNVSAKKKQVWAIARVNSLIKLRLCRLFSQSIKLRDMLESVYIATGLWNYILIVKVCFWLLNEYWVQSHTCCGDFFIIHLLNFCKPAWYPDFHKLSDSRVNIPLYFSSLCVMNVPHEKVKGKQGFFWKGDWSL